jgi:hypothetical protein
MGGMVKLRDSERRSGLKSSCSSSMAEVSGLARLYFERMVSMVASATRQAIEDGGGIEYQDGQEAEAGDEVVFCRGLMEVGRPGSAASRQDRSSSSHMSRVRVHHRLLVCVCGLVSTTKLTHGQPI